MTLLKSFVVALSLGSSLFAEEAKIGVMETAFGYRGKVESIALAKKAGYQGIQIHTGKLDAENVLTLSDPELLAEFRKASEEHEVEIISLCAGSMNKLTIWQKGPDRERGLAIMKQSLAACQALDCPILLFPFFGPSNFTQGEEKIAGVAEFMKELLPMAKEKGVTLGIESPIPYRRVMELFERLGNPDEIKMYYDTGNMMREGEDIFTALTEMGSALLCQIHIKPEGDIHFGKDQTDLPKLAQVLDQIDYRQWLVFEARGGVEEGREILARENLKGIRQLISLRKTP